MPDLFYFLGERVPFLPYNPLLGEFDLELPDFSPELLLDLLVVLKLCPYGLADEFGRLVFPSFLILLV